MISVVIPTRNAASSLPACLAALVPAVVDGLVADVTVVDSGSTDATRQIAEDAGCTVIAGVEGGRGPSLAAGAKAARKPWLLFLHADTVLDDGWHDEAASFMAAVEAGRRPPAAAAFRFALDDPSWQAAVIGWGVHVRCGVLKLPYGDQGLLIPRTLYDAVGGYPAIPLMEDVALIRALRRRQRVILRARAITSASRYRADGFARRVATNALCLSLYAIGVAPQRIEAIYRRSRTQHRDPP